MLYADYARRKMHNVVKLDTKEGYPLTVYNCANKNLKDYTIYGNTGGVGDKTENLFNYTEPYAANAIADGNGWFDVTIDNTEGTKAAYKWCFTKVNSTLKVDTSYSIVTEIIEYSGNIQVRIVSTHSVNPGQFKPEIIAPTTTGVFTNTSTTLVDFSACKNMLRTYCSCAAGQSGHVKFRIAVYEVQKDTFEPYDKYKIPIIVNGNEAAVIYRDAPLADGESINYKSDNLPDITLEKGTNTITADTEVKPSNIKIKYLKK